MILMYHIILYVFVRTTLCQKYTDNVFPINVTKHIQGMYRDCLSVPYDYTFPLKNVSLPYTQVWFSENNEFKQRVSSLKKGILRLNQLQPGEHEFGLRLEWGTNETYTYPKTVRVSVSAITKSPVVTMDTLIEGRPATLRCAAPTLCNRETAGISWRGASESPISQNDHRMRFSATSAVQIIPRADHHNTNITCQLHFRYNMLTEKTVTLKVQYPPKILSSSKCVHIKKEQVCKCVSHGNPLPTTRLFIFSELYPTKYSSNDSQTVEEVVHLRGSYNHNSTIICVSSNYLGNDTNTFHAQNLTSSFKSANKLNSNAQTVPWTITGVSLCLSLVMLIIVIFQYKWSLKKKCNEEVTMYASLRRISVEQEYSVSERLRGNQSLVPCFWTALFYCYYSS